MVAKPKSFNIAGKEFSLPTTEEYTLVKKYITELQKENKLYFANLKIEKQRFDLQKHMTTLEKASTQRDKDRIVIFDKLIKQMEDAKKESFKTLEGKAGLTKLTNKGVGFMPIGRGKGGGKEGIGVKEGIMIGIGLQLVKTLKDGIEQSRHIQLIEGVLSKSIGLLIDLVLLPFLPLIAYLLITFIEAILGVGLQWDAFAKAVGTPIALMVLAAGALATLLAGGIIYGTVKLALDAASAALYAWLTVATPRTLSFVGDITIAGVDILSEIALALIGISIGMFAVYAAVGLAIGLVVVELLKITGVLNAISDAGENFQKGATAWFSSLPGPIQAVVNILKEFLETLANILNLIPGMNILTDSKMSEIISAGTYDPTVMANLQNKYGTSAGYTAGEGYMVGGAKINSFATGGVVPGTGAQVAVVHGGETITPAGQSPGHTFNFNGYNDDQIVKKVQSIMRQNGARYRQ